MEWGGQNDRRWGNGERVVDRCLLGHGLSSLTRREDDSDPEKKKPIHDLIISLTLHPQPSTLALSFPFLSPGIRVNRFALVNPFSSASNSTFSFPSHLILPPPSFVHFIPNLKLYLVVARSTRLS